MAKPRNGSEEDRVIREKEFKQRLSEINPNLDITGKYINALTPIEFKCNKCGEDKQVAHPQSLLRLTSKCARCDSERKLVVGQNDFATTHPQYAELFKNKEEAKSSTYGSSSKFNVICPICKYEKKMRLYDLTRKGFSCPKCGDKVSYPTRFMTNLLCMLKIEYDNEKIFDWSQNRRYDFMVGMNLIEMDGGFHKGSTYMTYEDCKKIDDLKDNLAIEHGYNMIRIECYNSEFEYIKNNIVSSQLYDILNLDGFDWIELERELINNNLVKTASEIFNKNVGIKNMSEMASIMNITTAKLSSLLRTATRVGMSNYSVKESKNGIYDVTRGIYTSKECICLDTGKIYKSCKEAEDEYHLKKDAVARVCRGDRLTCSGKRFDFINTTDEIQNKKKSMEENKSKPSYNMRKVLCLETGIIYESSAEASRFLGKQTQYITGLIKKNRKTKDGYTFKYI